MSIATDVLAQAGIMRKNIEPTGDMINEHCDGMCLHKPA